MEGRGLAIPGHLFAPDLLPGADEFLTAFWELSTDRPVGMAVGSIPFSSISAYALWHSYEGADELAVLVRMIRACDRVFLDEQVKR